MGTHALAAARVQSEPELSTSTEQVQRILLVCGILSSLLYVGTDILVVTIYDGYSYTSQTVSELIAIGAPTRPLVASLMLTYGVLVIAFALGVWRSAGEKRALRLVAIGLIGKEVLGSIVTLFFPIHMRGVEGTLSDTMHGILTLVGSLFYLLAMGFGATAFGKPFRLYSIATILILVVFGVLAGLEIPRIAANLPTPWLGVWERINIFAAMLWIAVLALVLLRMHTNTGGIPRLGRRIS
jgi:hypothetical membrane protein